MSKLQDPAPTFDDVWRTIQELAQMGKETDRKFQETERLIKEGWAETDRRFQETDREIEKTAREVRDELDADQVDRFTPVAVLVGIVPILDLLSGMEPDQEIRPWPSIPFGMRYIGTSRQAPFWSISP